MHCGTPTPKCKVFFILLVMEYPEKIKSLTQNFNKLRINLASNFAELKWFKDRLYGMGVEHTQLFVELLIKEEIIIQEGINIKFCKNKPVYIDNIYKLQKEVNFNYLQQKKQTTPRYSNKAIDYTESQYNVITNKINEYVERLRSLNFKISNCVPEFKKMGIIYSYYFFQEMKNKYLIEKRFVDFIDYGYIFNISKFPITKNFVKEMIINGIAKGRSVMGVKIKDKKQYEIKEVEVIKIQEVKKEIPVENNFEIITELFNKGVDIKIIEKLFEIKRK